MVPTHVILEGLARDIWGRLREARMLNVRFGEETITDLLLLDLKRQLPGRVRVVQTPKHLEKNQGTDWEMWLGADRIGWLRFAVQAKKLDLATGRYLGFGHKVGSVYQIDLLERYARKNRAIPLYCLYNYRDFDFAQVSSAWRCCAQQDEELLACTVTPLSVVRSAANQYGCSNFEFVHSDSKTIPWGCLAKCVRVRRWYARRYGAFALPDGTGTSYDSEFESEVHVYHEVPELVRVAYKDGVIKDFASREYDPEVGQYPRRVAVIEYAPQEVEEIERLRQPDR